MKICDITHSYSPSSGGIRTYLEEKRRALVKHTDWEHCLIVPGVEDRVLQEGPFSHIEIASPPIPGSSPYRFLARGDRILEILRKEKPDLVEIQDPYLLDGPVFRYKSEHPCPVTAFYHTDIPSAYVGPTVTHWAGRWVGEWARGWSERELMKCHSKCDFVFCASKRYLRQLESRGLRNTHYIPLGVDLGLFHPAWRDETLRTRMGASSSDRVLIYVGRLDGEKRPGFLIEAFQALAPNLQAKLWLVGDGPQRPVMEDEARRDPRIMVLPYERDRQRLSRLLASADLYVTAGRYETFALSVLEAQASGLAVAGVRAGALVERVPVSAGELADPDSALSLAHAITTLLEDGYKERGRWARRTAESEFGWDRTFERLFLCYDGLVGKVPAP